MAALRTVLGEVLSLHSGYPDPALLPERLVRAAFGRAGRAAAAVGCAPSAGLPELRAWFAAELGSATAPGVTAPDTSDAIVLPGSQSGLGSVFRALVGAGQPLLIESPSYWGAMLAAAQVGVRLVPIPSGPAGPDPAELDRAFTETGARALYAQPNFSNPLGGQWSPERGAAILDTVRAHGAFLIEDDWAHDFGITTAPHPLAAHDDQGHVVYVRSLTKSVSPAVRVAGLIARGPARDRILADVQAQSLYVSAVLQAVALDVVSQPAWRSHLTRIRTELVGRRDLLVAAIREHAPGLHLEAVPKGGLNLWAGLPTGVDLPEFVRACEVRGVAVAAGDEWIPAEPTGPFVRLSFAGPHPAAFPEGARTIQAVLDGS